MMSKATSSTLTTSTSMDIDEQRMWLEMGAGTLTGLASGAYDEAIEERRITGEDGMEVLESGRKQKGWANEYTCNARGGGGCGAKLLVEEADLFKTYTTDMVGDSTTYINFKCPECGQVTTVKKNGVPRRVKDKAPSQKEWEKRNE